MKAIAFSCMTRLPGGTPAPIRGTLSRVVSREWMFDAVPPRLLGLPWAGFVTMPVLLFRERLATGELATSLHSLQ